MVFFRPFVQVDIFNGFLISLICWLILYFITFEYQIKTEPSSAGEQLARDIFDARQKCQSKETAKCFL